MYTVDLPEQDDLHALHDLLDELKKYKTQKGITTLIKWLSKYLMHKQQAFAHWQRAVSVVNFVNGVRLHTQKLGDKKRAVRADATKFYAEMSTPMLRKHCGMFGLDYNSYDSQEEIMAELVQRHVDMVGE
jgi:hypothetical protein